MKFIKYMFALSAIAACSLGFASTHSVTLNDMGGKLTIGGEVGVEHTVRALKLDDNNYYGTKGVRYKLETDEATGDVDAVRKEGFSMSNFDLDVCLMLDYENNGSWFSSKLRSNYEMGGGAQYISRDDTVKTFGLLFEEAYFGSDLYQDGASTLSFNIGRRQLSKVYDSVIQFDSRTRHDGLSLTYMTSLEALGDFKVTASRWVHNEANHWYPWATELRLSNIMDTGLYAQYSYISWEKKADGKVLSYQSIDEDQNFRQKEEDYFYGSARSRNSQIAAGYVFGPELLGIDWKVYGAYLLNHSVKKNMDSMVNLDADRTLVNTMDKKENSAYYVGTTFGKIDGEGSYEVDLNYQHVKQNAILASDLAGIGRYNKMGPNYKGFSLKAKYAFTDNLSLVVSYMDAKQANKNYAGMLHSVASVAAGEAGAMKRHLKRVETELWYKF